MSRSTDLRRFVPVLFAGLLTAVACVSNELDRYESAKAAYEDCLADPMRGESECEALRAEVRVRGQRYEEKAQRAWGCGNSPEACKPPRGP